MKRNLLILLMSVLVNVIFAQSTDYLCFTAVNGAATVKLDSVGTPYSISLQYSTNRTTWSSYSIRQTISLSSGGKVYFRATSSNSSFSRDVLRYYKFVMTGTVAASGKITSLLDINMTRTSVPMFAFYSLFASCAGLTSAPELPATTLSNYCYQNMFYNCTSLTSAPVLPATVMKEQCYRGMFGDCSSLTVAPALPAMTLADNCYSAMFSGCTSLTSTPALPATTLSVACYNQMFHNCTSLATAPALPATTVARSCYWEMFNGCRNLTVAPTLPATTLDVYCYYRMFWNCTRLTTAPALPATTLSESCYGSMFSNCSALTAAPALPATTLTEGCYCGMFSGCTALTSAPVLPAMTMTEDCYNQMFVGCRNLAVAPSLPSTALADDCYKWMFKNCTSLTTVPDLPATTLTDRCYYEMFKGCTNVRLNLTGSGNIWKIPSAAATSAASATNWGTNMFSGTGGTLTGQPTPGQNYYDQNAQPTQIPDYLCFTAVNGAATVRLATSGSNLPTVSLEYSTNGTTWLSYTLYSTISLPSGGKVYFRATSTNSGMSSSTGYRYFVMTGSVAASGNITSLIDKNMTATSVNAYAYRFLFYQCTSLISAPELPATTLGVGCYSAMFNGCSNLTSIPSLPATTLPDNCYSTMFYGCTSLTSVPDLVATSLSNRCCQNMFKNCTSLTTAPALPATTMAGSYCYGNMFENCTSLTVAPALPATTLAFGCYWAMFRGCTSLTVAPALPASVMAEQCYYLMFGGCTALTSAPALPSTSLAVSCYDQMFYGCTSLTTASALPATTMYYNCYSKMFYGCSSLDAAPQLPATTMATACYDMMFVGCTSLTEPPVLPATTVTGYCYRQMFDGCTNIRLNLVGPGKVWKIPAAAATSASSSQDWNVNMFRNTSGTFTGQPTPGRDYYFLTSAPIPATVTVNVVGLGTVTGAGTYIVGDTVTLTATPDSGYVFTGWSNGATSSTITIIVAGDTTITANFGQMPNYLCFTAVNGPATIKLTGVLTAPPSISLEYSTNGTSWSSYTINQTISLTSGNKVYFRATNTNYSLAYLPYATLTKGYHRFVMTGTIAASGNVMSLLDKTMTTTSLNKWAFAYLFNQCTSLISPPELPATTLACRCYLYMFRGCSNLTSAPALPALAMDSSCYDNMFASCTSLTTPPALPATTMAYYCYGMMFEGCTALNSVPVLPATVMADRCYYAMFAGCTALTTVPVLSATKLGSYCYCRMFEGCTGLTSAPALPATTLSSSCYYNMFKGCTGLTAAPALPATTLAVQCYWGMFRNCTALTIVPTLPATTLAQSCYRDMFYGCTNIKLYPTGSGQVWKIPAAASTSAASAANWGTDMFTGSGGTLQGQPVVGQDYYYNPTVPKGTVTVVANPANGGSVTGGGMYNVGSIARVTATPATGYHFTGWSNGSTATTISFTVTGDTTLVASFAQNIYTVTGAANPANGGVVVGGGSYTYGSNVTLTAVAVNGYRFTGWSNGVTSGTISFVVTGDTVLIANFVPVSHSVTVIANPANGGVVSGGGTYIAGSTAMIIAIPATGYHFAGWSNGAATDTLSFAVTGDTVLVANFVQNLYAVTLVANPTTGGTVSGGGAYSYGTAITITAAPATGYRFTGWSDGSTASSRSMVVTDDVLLTANFDKITCTVTTIVDPASTGSISGGGTYYYGDTVTVVASAAYGYDFIGWHNSGDTSNVAWFVVTGDTVVIANFILIPYTVTAAVSDPSAGVVSGGGVYAAGDTAVISVTVADGYYFTGWSNGATTTTISVVVTGDTTLTAMFGRYEHCLTVMVNDTSYGRVKVSGSYYHGDIVTLTAISDAHCRLAYWSTGDTTAVIQVMIVSDTTIEAFFEWDEYVVTAVSNDSACGMVRGSGVFRYGDVAELTAVAEDGCRFVSWNNGMTASSIQITVVKDTTLTAYFETIPEVGVEDVEVGEYVAYCDGRNIVVHGAEGRSVVVYDMMGRLVGMVADGSFEVYAAGVYLVAVDGRAVARIVVR